jgi:uncharacterized membrane protein
MGRLKALLYSFGIGAGLMYFWDPSRGDRRRALVRDRVVSLRHDADDAIDKAVRDARNRMRGMTAEMTARLSDDGAPSWILEERVRSQLGFVVSHPRAIDVRAEGDTIHLSGPILKEDVDGLIKAVRRTRGVRDVVNNLEIHNEPGNIPALQGGSRAGKRKIELQEDVWSPSLRLLTGAGGGLLALYGMTRKGLVGTTLGMAGLGLAARGVTNIDMKSMLGMGTARDAIRIQKAININAPVHEIYNFWSNFENFPRFMAHVKEVRDLGNGRSHWKVAGPAGKSAEWDAIVTQKIPNEVIAWESVGGSEVRTQGKVQFKENRDGSTRITVHLHYTPPAGVIGHAVATMFGMDPKSAMDDDLARLKSLFEQGETTVKDRKVTRQDLPGMGTAG